MSQVITGSFSESNNQQTNCDFAQSLAFTRANRDRLSVAIVADGGNNKQSGRMLAQIAVNSVVTYLKRSDENGITDLLNNAIQLANRLVASSFQSDLSGLEEKPGCSLAVAVIVNNERLYIANVGGCQVYLVRKQNLSQLTLDHAYKNISTIQGKMDLATASCNPKANSLVWQVGVDHDIQVDTGFHVGLGVSKNSYQLAQRRGTRGLPIEVGDSIVVCSDGLGQSRLDEGKPFILKNEMVQVLSSQTGDRGARGLVSFSLGRGATDDVSVALLQSSADQLEHPFNGYVYKKWQNRMLTIGSVTALFLALCVTTAFFLQSQSQTQAEASSIDIEVAQLVLAEKDAVQAKQLKLEPTVLPTISSPITVVPTASTTPIPTSEPPTIPTAIPTHMVIHKEHTQAEAMAEEAMPIPTLRPTLQPNILGIYRSGAERSFPTVFEDQVISVDQNSEFQINHQATTDELIEKLVNSSKENLVGEASLYTLGGSSVEFMQVDEQVEFRLFEESDVLIETGVYTAGAKIEVRTPSEDVTFTVENSCMSVVYSEENHVLNSFCFAGSCQFKIGRHDSVHIPEGQRVSFNPEDVTNHPEFAPISSAVALSYQNLLLNFYSGIEDSQTCLAPYFNQAAADH